MTEMLSFPILLVEDDPADQKLIRNSLKKQRILNELHVVSSGEEGMDFLRRRGAYERGAARPSLILLDLNMPGMGGKEFLRRMKNDDELKDIPVIVLTTSDSEQDVIDSYRLQANGYVRKPVTLEAFVEVMKGIEDYWFLLCERPPRD